MELLLYHRLSTRSRRALLKSKGRYGHNYFYQPRGTLLQRLARETGMSVSEVALQLASERRYLLEENG